MAILSSMSPEEFFHLEVDTLNTLSQRVSHKERLYFSIKKNHNGTESLYCCVHLNGLMKSTLCIDLDI